MKIKKIKTKFFTTFTILYLFFFFYGLYKPLEKNTSFEGKIYNLSPNEIKFISDQTYYNDSQKILKQNIFNNIFSMIDQARDFIIIDMFLWQSSQDLEYLPLAKNLTNKLIEKNQKKI